MLASSRGLWHCQIPTESAKCCFGWVCNGSGVMGQGWWKEPSPKTPNLFPWTLLFALASPCDLPKIFSVQHLSPPPPFWVVRFFYFCHGKNKLLFWEHVGFKPMTVSALRAWKMRSTACVPEGLACVSEHIQPGWQGGGSVPPGSSRWGMERPQLPGHRARDPIPALKWCSKSWVGNFGPRGKGGSYQKWGSNPRGHEPIGS